MYLAYFNSIGVQGPKILFLGGPVPPLYMSFPGVGTWVRGYVGAWVRGRKLFHSKISSDMEVKVLFFIDKG